MTHAASAEEDHYKAGGNGEMVNLHITPGITRRMIGIHQEILREAVRTREGSETRAEEERQTATYCLVLIKWDESDGQATTLYKQDLEGVGDLELEELEDVHTKCVQNHCGVAAIVLDNRGHRPWKVRRVLDSGAGI